jgi:hypothetical protein
MIVFFVKHKDGPVLTAGSAPAGNRPEFNYKQSRQQDAAMCIVNMVNAEGVKQKAESGRRKAERRKQIFHYCSNRSCYLCLATCYLLLLNCSQRRNGFGQKHKADAEDRFIAIAETGLATCVLPLTTKLLVTPLRRKGLVYLQHPFANQTLNTYDLLLKTQKSARNGATCFRLRRKVHT